MAESKRDEQLAHFEAALASLPEPTREGEGMPRAAVNGHMFAFLDTDGRVCVRLSEADRVAHEAEHGDAPVMLDGQTMHGFVEVPEAILEDATVAADLFKKSYKYVKILKPK